MYEETSAYLRFTGSDWKPWGWSGASGGQYQGSTVAGDRLDFRFVGSGVRWWTIRASNRGVADVYIDNSYKGRYDMRSDTVEAWVEPFEGLSYGVHDLRIVVVSSGLFVSVDALYVLGVPTATPTPTATPSPTPTMTATITPTSTSTATATTTPTATATPDRAVVWVSPGSVSIAPQATATVELRVDWVSGLYGVEIHATFDPNVLQVASVAANPDWSEPNAFVVTQNQIDNVNGWINFASARLGSAGALSGNLPIASVTFRRTGSGTASIRIDNSTRLSDADSQPILWNGVDGEVTEAGAQVVLVADQGPSGTPGLPAGYLVLALGVLGGVVGRAGTGRRRRRDRGDARGG